MVFEGAELGTHSLPPPHRGMWECLNPQALSTGHGKKGTQEGTIFWEGPYTRGILILAFPEPPAESEFSTPGGWVNMQE